MTDRIKITQKQRDIIVVTLIIITVILVPLVITSLTSESANLINRLTFKSYDLTENQNVTLSSLEKIDDHPLYVMNYCGDYGFDDYILTGIEGLSGQKGLEINVACTCFVTLNNKSDILFGRNFDLNRHPALVLYTSPPDGYKSISMVDLKIVEQLASYVEDHYEKAFPAHILYSPYWLFDGMNEHGLTIALMSVPQAESLSDPAKITISHLDYMRLALDHAQNIEEVFDLWEDFNIQFLDDHIHFLIADSEGNSAVVEWVENEMKILRNEEMWQFATNFVIYGSSETEKQTCWRYRTCKSVLSNKNGKINQIEAFGLLESVAQSNTQWSAVYNIAQRSVQIIMGRHYDNPVHEFFL